MAMDEKALNSLIARAMQRQAPRGYTVRVEYHGAARAGATSPDFVALMPYGLRTIIETEYDAPGHRRRQTPPGLRIQRLYPADEKRAGGGHPQAPGRYGL